jgi:pyridoxal 5'-phosphate synthase pdxT subunit
MRNRLREILIAASRQSRSEMRSSMKIGILAVQGAFAEHEQMLEQLGAEYIELRKGEDVRQSYDGLILPGGESTVQGKLMRELDMFDTVQSQIKNGMPVLATCAGAILLAQQLSNDAATHLATLPAVVRRNAYGRQLGSFSVDEQIEGIGTFPMRFIRAPYIEKALDDTKVLAKVDGNIVMVENKNQLAMSFHPELTSDTRIHEMFLRKI